MICRTRQLPRTHPAAAMQTSKPAFHIIFVEYMTMQGTRLLDLQVCLNRHWSLHRLFGLGLD